VEAAAANGLFLSLGGGVAAALGGLAVVLREMPVRAPVEDTLEAIAVQMSDEDRRALLQVLETSDRARAEAMRSFCARPGKASWKPILDELERDQRLRRDVIEALRTVRASLGADTPHDSPPRGN
jgi:hypothetical protein